MSTDPASDEVEQRAAELLEGAVPFDVDLPPMYVTRLVHQLQVHQIELEMQNDELHRAWTAAEEASTAHDELFDLAPLPYLVVGFDGSVISANRAARRLLGSEQAAVTGRTVTDFVQPIDRPRWRRALEASASGEDVDRFTVDLTTDGTPQVLVCLAPSTDDATCRVLLVDHPTPPEPGDATHAVH